MVKMDPNADLFPEGVYFFEVDDCVETFTKSKGESRFMLTLKDVHTGRTYKTGWMMQGGGAPITVRNLKKIGVTDFDDVRPEDLHGRRFYAQIKHKDNSQFGMQAEISSIWNESKPPASFVEPPVEMPFDAREVKPADQGGSDNIPF